MLNIHKDQDTRACAFSWSWRHAEAGTQPEASGSVYSPVPSSQAVELPHLQEYLAPREAWALAERWVPPALLMAISVKKLGLFPFLLSINPPKAFSG